MKSSYQSIITKDEACRTQQGGTGSLRHLIQVVLSPSIDLLPGILANGESKFRPYCLCLDGKSRRKELANISQSGPKTPSSS
uniref:HDC19522 n=1 Tax=Drosophila melanogaster TaxID=7227 RepID=Q6II78_DROME|nr:TPA_inf: HDC19522 [Drosophila melanogaster]